jgi:hypothetical protein
VLRSLRFGLRLECARVVPLGGYGQRTVNGPFDVAPGKGLAFPDSLSNNCLIPTYIPVPETTKRGPEARAGFLDVGVWWSTSLTVLAKSVQRIVASDSICSGCVIGWFFGFPEKRLRIRDTTGVTIGTAAGGV